MNLSIKILYRPIVYLHICILYIGVDQLLAEIWYSAFFWLSKSVISFCCCCCLKWINLKMHFFGSDAANNLQPSAFSMSLLLIHIAMILLHLWLFILLAMECFFHFFFHRTSLFTVCVTALEKLVLSNATQTHLQRWMKDRQAGRRGLGGELNGKNRRSDRKAPTPFKVSSGFHFINSTYFTCTGRNFH